MREQLVAWAEDCRVEGEVDLDGGRLSDAVNELEIIVFREATLVALEDGHVVREPEIEVARRELSLIEVTGRRGDPARRHRTVAEHVRLEVGPYTVIGDLHRSPSLPALNALTRWSRFVPVTDALVELGGGREPAHHDVVLVNRDRIREYHELFDAGPAWIQEPDIDAAELPLEVGVEPPPVSPAP